MNIEPPSTGKMSWQVDGKPRVSKYPNMEVLGPDYYTYKCFWDLVHGGTRSQILHLYRLLAPYIIWG